MSRNHIVRYQPRRDAVTVDKPYTVTVPDYVYPLVTAAYRTMRRANIPDWRARQLILNTMLAGRATQMGSTR